MLKCVAKNSTKDLNYLKSLNNYLESMLCLKGERIIFCYHILIFKPTPDPKIDKLLLYFLGKSFRNFRFFHCWTWSIYYFDHLLNLWLSLTFNVIKIFNFLSWLRQKKKWFILRNILKAANYQYKNAFLKIPETALFWLAKSTFNELNANVSAPGLILASPVNGSFSILLKR